MNLYAIAHKAASYALEHKTDTATIGVGLTAPWWVQYSTTWLGWVAALAAAVVGIGRMYLMIRDWRNGDKG